MRSVALDSGPAAHSHGSTPAEESGEEHEPAKGPPLVSSAAPAAQATHYGSILLIVIGQAARARRIKTASEESPSRRRSQSSSTSKAAKIGAAVRAARFRASLDRASTSSPPSGPSTSTLAA